jgi:hypothetical protein
LRGGEVRGEGGECEEGERGGERVREGRERRVCY